MSVWCVSLMAVLGRLSQETQGDPTTEGLLDKAAGDLRNVLDLIKTRNKTGILAKAASLWTAREFKEKMTTASDSIEKAIQALSLSVSAQTKHDVNQVLSKVDLLPRMDEKLNALNDKMDEVLKLTKKASDKEKTAARRQTSMAACEIDQHHVKQGDFIAEGGQGKVYKATYAGQPAAMKVVQLEGTILKKEKLIKAFMTEIDLTIRLRHPNVIQVYGVITADANCLKVIMDYAPDGSLREFLDENPTVLLPQETQIKYVKQLCHGLQYLHDSKVAHKDFKSLNVLRRQETMLITDFGLSKDMDTGTTTWASAAATTLAESSYGTISWTAPEIFKDRQADPYKADLYALGVVIWEISTRKFPFKGDRKEFVIGSVGYGNQRPGKPEDCGIRQLQEVVTSCWKQDPRDRKTADELLDILALNPTTFYT